MSTIKTLDYVEQQAKMIASSWKGKDPVFFDAEGNKRTEDDAHMANDLLNLLEEVNDIVDWLKI